MAHNMELLRRNKFLTEQEAEEIANRGVRELTQEDLRNEPDRDRDRSQPGRRGTPTQREILGRFETLGDVVGNFTRVIDRIGRVARTYKELFDLRTVLVGVLHE